MADFFEITNEIPLSGMTRSELLEMLKTLKPAPGLVDNATIKILSTGKLAVDEVPQALVAGLIAKLDGKQPLSAKLSSLADLGTNGLVFISTNTVSTKTIGSDIQAHAGLLDSIAAIVGAGLVFQDGAGNASRKQIGVDVQAYHDLLESLGGLADPGLLYREGDGTAGRRVIGLDVQQFDAKLKDVADLSLLSAGDIVQWNGTNFVKVSRQAAVADVDDSTMPVSISDPPTKAEVDGLRTTLIDTVAKLEALRDRLKATGGNGLIADV